MNQVTIDLREYINHCLRDYKNEIAFKMILRSLIYKDKIEEAVIVDGASFADIFNKRFSYLSGIVDIAVYDLISEDVMREIFGSIHREVECKEALDD